MGLDRQTDIRCSAGQMLNKTNVPSLSVVEEEEEGGRVRDSSAREIFITS